MIIATDLDRTLLPNGDDEYDDTLNVFFDAVKKNKLTLAYVSGRNMDLLEQAIAEFGIETPDFFIGSVGTEIFVKKNDILIPYEPWSVYLNKNAGKWSRDMFVEKIGEPKSLSLQEDSVQNEFKLSYYVDEEDAESIVASIKKALSEFEKDIDVVYSIDPLKKIGLIDVLPKIATKVTALAFLRDELGLTDEDVIYAGDSGNDILPLTAGFKSILVKNAHPDTKEDVMRINKDKELSSLYIAHGEGEYNGNYSSGILEGMKYFGVTI